MDAIHIMKAGRHTPNEGTDVSFTEQDFRDIAAVYDPAMHEAPIVIGHPKGDAPAYGWVDRLEVRKEGLFAVPKQVNAEFSELVRQGAFKKVSASFYRPDNAAGNPAKGKWYLRHVGFLGAQPPAVKGLKPVNFADGSEGFADFEEGLMDLREERLAARERALRKKDDDAFIEALVSKGVLPIGLKEETAAFMESLSEDAVVNFSEDDGTAVSKSQVASFREFLEKLPSPVVRGEICTGDFSETADFSAPAHTSVDQDRMELHRQATSYQKHNNVTYQQAVLAVSRR